ncbi:MAG: hypothetical protein IIC40_06020, partial [Candidatus Marinimicrobia bacterium]|nr:hypothetical protein [Candidatus Neomarinimicrobiota bacterium]
MSKFLSIVFISLFLSNSESTAQINYKVGEWRVESSKLIVRAMNSFGDEVYAGTSGGLVIYSPTGSKTITVLDGLSSLDILSMAIDKRGIVILGMNSPTGNIDFYSASDGSIYSIDENLTKITAIAVVGDSIFAGFIAQDQIGVLLITYDSESERYQFRDSFLNFPQGFSFSEVTAVSIIQDSIYLGTDRGLLSASILGDNLYIRFWFLNGPNGGSFLRVINKNNGTFVRSQNIGSFTSEILSTEDFLFTNPETGAPLVSNLVPLRDAENVVPTTNIEAVFKDIGVGVA